MKLSELAELALRCLRNGGKGEERFVFDPTAFEAFRGRLEKIGSGQDAIPHIVDLGFLASYLLSQRCDHAAAQLLAVVEKVAGPVLANEHLREVEKTGDRMTEFGKRFETFLGSQGEKLPDTGERLDVKPFKGPIRG